MNWLIKLPSTNALVATVIFMVVATTIRVMVDHWTPPDGWFPFVISFATLVSAHFTAKRITHRKAGAGGPPDSDGTAAEA